MTGNREMCYGGFYRHQGIGIFSSSTVYDSSGNEGSPSFTGSKHIFK